METKFKYNEPEYIQEAFDYIASKYGQHYVGKEDVQTIDVWDSLNIAGEMCQGTAIKYLMRFGKKDGINRKDLLKTIHYTILLLHFTDEQNGGKD